VHDHDYETSQLGSEALYMNAMAQLAAPVLLTDMAPIIVDNDDIRLYIHQCKLTMSCTVHDIVRTVLS